MTAQGLSDDGSLYTLLLVDTPNSILHFGAVNVDYAFLTSGQDDIDQADSVFSSYRGPSPPKFLILIPGVYQTLFNYEWVLKCDWFRMINPVYNFIEEQQQFEVSNDSRCMFYARCRLLPEGDLTSP